MKVNELLGEGHTWDMNLPSNTARAQAGMDREARDVKRREHEAEWEQEQRVTRGGESREAGTWYITINGKVWARNGEPVAFNGKKHANAAGLTILKRKPDAVVKITTNPQHSVTESASAGGTSAANVGVGAVYQNTSPKKQKPTDNALNMKTPKGKGNLLTGGSCAKR